MVYLITQLSIYSKVKVTSNLVAKIIKMMGNSTQKRSVEMVKMTWSIPSINLMNPKIRFYCTDNYSSILDIVTERPDR